MRDPLSLIDSYLSEVHVDTTLHTALPEQRPLRLAFVFLVFETLGWLPFFTDSSLQASQQDTKTQGVTKEEEKRRIEAKESDTSTTRPRYETSFDE